MKALIRSTSRWPGMAAILVLAGGCGGGFGESVSVPQHRRTAIDAGFASGMTLALPRDRHFNVADAQRHSSGAGRAESSATADGTAGCRALVEGPGTAWAEFQLGHVIHHQGSEALEAAVLFDCEYEYAVTGPNPAAHAPEMVALKLYIKDSNKTMLRQETLAEHAGTLGAQRRTGRESPSFNITLQPGIAYQLVAAGRVEVAATDEQTPVEARIKIAKLAIEVQAR